MEKSFPGIISGLKLVDNFKVMKRLKVILVFFAFGIIFYLYWRNKLDSGKLNLPLKNSKKIETISNEKSPIFPIPQKPIEKLDSTEESREIYISKINKIIKKQYQEIEECEKEFDAHFGDLLKMNKEKQLEYIKDPNNLDNLLDKFSNINFTTPSSAKVIKELANPMSEQVKVTEIYHKPGSQDRVDICSPRGKRDILELLYKSKIKKKAIIRPLIEFFENENSTLNYPHVLFDQIIELKKLLKIQGVKESEYPQLGKIDKDFKAFDKKISEIMNELSPRENATWDYQEEKLEYEFALKLQADIKMLLNQIKEDLAYQRKQ